MELADYKEEFKTLLEVISGIYASLEITVINAKAEAELDNLKDLRLSVSSYKQWKEGTSFALAKLYEYTNSHLTLIQNEGSLTPSKRTILNIINDLINVNEKLWHSFYKELFLFKLNYSEVLTNLKIIIKKINDINQYFKYNGIESPNYLTKRKEVEKEIIKDLVEKNAQTTSSDCFVATLVYESNAHPKVVLLREYRDMKLIKTFWGRTFIKGYYQIGPYLAKLIRKSDILTRVSRKIIDHIVLKISNQELKKDGT